MPRGRAREKLGQLTGDLSDRIVIATADATAEMLRPVKPLRGTSSQPGMARVRRRRPVFRKYLAVYVLLVGGALLVSASSQLFFSYQETRSALAAVQHEKAASAAIQTQQFLADIAHQVSVGVQTPGVNGALSGPERREEYLRLLRQVPAITELLYVDAC
jgi:hypothetical protein